MKKAPYKLKFKKWWWYLFPKRRKWLKQVNEIMTSEKIVAPIMQATQDAMACGTGIIRYDETGMPHSVPPGEFLREHPDIKLP